MIRPCGHDLHACVHCWSLRRGHPHAASAPNDMPVIPNSLRKLIGGCITVSFPTPIKNVDGGEGLQMQGSTSRRIGAYSLYAIIRRRRQQHGRCAVISRQRRALQCFLYALKADGSGYASFISSGVTKTRVGSSGRSSSSTR